jgi:hypothetical protein
VTGTAWFSLPALTPILVMLAALVLQRLETIVMNQVDPAPVQESRIAGPSVPPYGFDAKFPSLEAIPSPRAPLL